MKWTKSVVVFCDHTREKTETIIFFIFLGGGGGLFAKVLKLAVNRRTKFRNIHWLEKSCTTVDDKPWKLFCKTSLNVREKLFSKSVDKRSVWPYEF